MSNGTLGTLNIDVLANIAGMVSDMGKATAESAKASREFQSQWKESINSVREGFVGLTELVGAGIGIEVFKEIATQAFETAERVENLTAALGMSSQMLQTVSFAAAKTDAGLSSFGGSMEIVDAAMARMERSAEQAAAGTQQQAEAFRALGISSQQLVALLKDPDQLIKVLSQHIAEAGDGAGKTAAIMQIFGRNAGQLTPFLDQLGKGFEEAKKQGEALHVVLGEQDQQSLAETQKSLNVAAQAAHGLANEFAVAIAPAVKQASEAFVQFVETSGIAKTAGENFGLLLDVVKTLAEIKIAEWAINGAVALRGMATAAYSTEVAIASVKGTLTGIGAFIAGWNIGEVLYQKFAVVREIGQWLGAALATIKEALTRPFELAGDAVKVIIDSLLAWIKEKIANGLEGIAQSMAQSFNPVINQMARSFEAMAVSMRPVQSSAETFHKGMEQIGVAAKSSLTFLKDMWSSIGDDAEAAGKLSTKTEDVAKATKHASNALVDYNANASQSQSYAKTWAMDMQKLNDMIDLLSSGLSGPYEAALTKYQSGFKTLNQVWQDAVIQGKVTDDLINQLADAGALLEQSLDDTNAKIKEQHDEFGKLNDQLNLQLTLLHTMPQDQAAVTAGLAAYNTALKANVDLYGEAIPAGRDIHDVLNKQLPDWIALKQRVDDASQAVKNQNQVWKDWENIAKNAFDSLAAGLSKTLVEGGSFMSSLKDTAKQTVEAIIQEFLKLEFIGPLMHAIFGDAASAMGYSAAGMSGMGGLVGSLFGGGGSSFGSSGSIVGSIAQAFGGGGSSGSGGGMLGDANSLFGVGKTIWSGFSDGFSSFIGTNPALMGPPTAAGQLTSFQPGYTSGLGQALGVAGGLYAGYNEFNAAGGGVAGLAGGAAYGVGTYFAGAAVSTALSSGIAAGMAAIPVVGWIALAAMGLNMLTGGGLFGTAAKPIGGDFTTTIGDGGATLTNILHEKGKKALFGGSYYKDVNQAIDPQAQAAADQFFAALKKSTGDFADYFGVTVSNVVGGSFTQKYDKNGKPTTTTDTVNGQTFTGETAAQFQERIQAENYIAVLDKLGVNATEYAKTFIGNADDLIKAIQDLAAASQEAYADIKRGAGLIGSSGSLGDVMKEVEKLAAGGEALADTYKRLVTENDAWRGSMEASTLALNESSTKTLEFADSLAKAFGSASAMQTALATFDKSYYTPQQLAAQKLSNDQAQLASLGAGIGQSPTETMAQFKQAFDAVEASLTPDQLAQWINFGNLLAQVTGEVNSAAQAAQTAANNYAQFMAQFTPAASGFEQAMQKVQVSLADNIAQANALAVANGQAGASAADIGKIISASVMQGVAAVQQLETEAASLAQTLFQGDLPSQITALQTKLAADQAAYKGGDQFAGLFAHQDQQQLTALQAQYAAQQEAAKKQQQFMQAAQLLGDLGQIGAVTGQGLGDFAKMFNIPLDKFASILGTDQAGLAKEFAKQEDMAKSALETAANTKYSAEIQADILDVLSGKTPHFSTEDIYNTLTGQPLAQQATGGKGTGPIGATGPGANGTAATISPTGTTSDPVVTKNPDTTTAVNSQTPILREIRDLLRDNTAVRDRYYAPRNTRPAMV